MNNEPEDIEEAPAIDTKTFAELILPPDVCTQALQAWSRFLASMGHEAAGEAVYQALFDGNPALQALFTTPRRIQAMRLMQSLSSLLNVLNDPPALYTAVEALGFIHLSFDISVQRASSFRDAIMNLLESELGDHLTEAGQHGWTMLLNYVAGAIIYVREHYSVRLSILSESWKAANQQNQRGVILEDLEHDEEDEIHNSSGDKEPTGGLMHKLGGKAGLGKGGLNSVPQNFEEMFKFNQAVMGFSDRLWMQEVLTSFDSIVSHVADAGRLSQECEVLAIKLSKRFDIKTIVLPEYKSCMLAALRSLIPRSWDSSHEVAWSWLWDQVDARLTKTLGTPLIWEAALARLLATVTQDQKTELRQATLHRFFVLAPVGQDYFIQSETRLQFIIDRIMVMTFELLEDPWKMVDEISALGLRHVGFGIPTVLFTPFVNAYMEAVEAICDDTLVLEAFRWSLGLLAQMLVRTINEGSTIVMKAINVNSPKQLKKAAGCAPRGERAKWLLIVQVGNQNISPLYWALESGSHAAAEAIITDLLTIRADRERYYYGVDDMFLRHPDVVERIAVEAKALLGTFLDGLVWRSRQTKEGMRRANFYIKHLVVNNDGGVGDCLTSIAKSRDPTVMCDPAVNLTSEILWNGIVQQELVLSKLWLFVSITVFMLCQTVLPRIYYASVEQHKAAWMAIFMLRMIIYLFTMLRLTFQSVKDILVCIRKAKFSRIVYVPVPSCFLDPGKLNQMVLSVLLILMAIWEPMFYCLSDPGWPMEVCPKSQDLVFTYSVFGMCSMALHYLLFLDLAVMSTGLCAFVLVCAEVSAQLIYFIIALAFALMTFACMITVLSHTYLDWSQLPETLTGLYAVTIQLFQDDYRDFAADPILMIVLFMFLAVVRILLMNVLIAQLNCSYVFIYDNVVGYARLKRADVIVKILSTYSPKKWKVFVDGLGFDLPLEFNEGDVGMSGGVQIEELASEHLVSYDRILRYGGTCAVDAPWPDEAQNDARAHGAVENDDEKVKRLESQLRRMLKKISSMSHKTQRHAGGSSASAGRSMSSDGSSVKTGSSE